ncbi:MAG: hypothetical protein K1X88_23625 [Nannocystaceae bacterium]|nr:hypothetical protein [Nannocystaceae bacterium]
MTALIRAALRQSVLALACGRVEATAVGEPVSTARASDADAALPRCDALADVPLVPTQVPMGIISAAPSSFAALREAGFTMVGPWYRPAPDRALLDAAADAGLGVVFPVGYPHDRYLAEHTIAWDAARIEAELTAQIAAVADHRAIVAWYLEPEELRYWRPEELAYLRRAVATIHAADPRARPVLGYQPNARDAQQLAPVLAHFDIGSKGAYVGFAGHRDRRAWMRWSVAQLREATPTGRPVWVLTEMFEDPPAGSDVDIAAWVRHDVFASLLAGADGVLVYSGWRRPGFGAYDAYLAAYRDVAHALNHQGLAAVLRGGRRCRSAAARVVDGPDAVALSIAGRAERWPSLQQVELRAGDEHWIWLVNSAAAPIVVEHDALPPGPLAYGHEHAARTDAGLWLGPHAVVALRERVGAGL